MAADFQELRHRHFLRLNCDKFEHLFRSKAPVVGRGVIAGIDAYLLDIFGADAYAHLNESMAFVAAEAKGASGEAIWRSIFADDIRFHAPIRLLIRTVAPFEDFDVAMRFLIATVNAHLPQHHSYLFDEHKFHVLFACWFGDLFRFVATAGTRFDPIYGDGQAAKLLTILEALTAHKPPVGTAAEGNKPEPEAQPQSQPETQ